MPDAVSSGMWDRLARLPLAIDGVSLQSLDMTTASGWTRRTTIVRLIGSGCCGEGEEVNYDSDEQLTFRRAALPELAGSTTLGAFSRRLDALDLCYPATNTPSSRMYRRWAFESAALELALRQADTTLGQALGRAAQRVRFVASLNPGGEGIAALQRRLDLRSDLRFKLDWSPQWTDRMLTELAALDAVDVVDFKGAYRGAFRGPEADAAAYLAVAEALPSARLEDPDWTPEVAAALEPHRSRVTWDAIIHGPQDVWSLPFRPGCINIKPSRFGSIAGWLRTLEWCEGAGVAMYGGGQFELGPGRRQIQAAAAIFHPDAPNDVAPTEFHEVEKAASLPGSPLPATAF